MADAYLAAHRQVLIEQAAATIASRPTLRKFYEREQCRRAKLFNKCTKAEASEINDFGVISRGAAQSATAQYRGFNRRTERGLEPLLRTQTTNSGGKSTVSACEYSSNSRAVKCTGTDRRSAPLSGQASYLKSETSIGLRLRPIS